MMTALSAINTLQKQRWLHACAVGICALGVLSGVCLSGMNDVLLSVHLLVLTLFSVCIVPALYIRKTQGSVDLFHPAVFLPLFYFIYFGIGPYLYLMRVELDFAANVVPIGMLPSLVLLSIIGIVCFHIGFASGNMLVPYKTRSDRHGVGWDNQGRLLWYIVLTLLFFIVVNLLFWWSAGGIPVFISDYYKASKTDIMAGKGYFEFLALSIVPVALVLINWFLYLERPSRVLKVMITLLFMVTLTLLIMNLVRGMFLSFIIFSVIGYHYAKMRLQLHKLLMVFVGLLFLASLAGYLRSSQWSDSEWFVGNIILLEAAVEFDNYAKTVELVPEQLELQLGKTIVPLFTTPIPRALFPQKDDFVPAQVMVKEFLGHDFLRVGERITLVAELFMNFHLLGVCFGMALYGFLSALVYRRFYPAHKNPLQLTLYVLTLAGGLAYQIPGDIASVTLGYIQLITPVMALYLFSHVRNTLFVPGCVEAQHVS